MDFRCKPTSKLLTLVTIQTSKLRGILDISSDSVRQSLVLLTSRAACRPLTSASRDIAIAEAGQQAESARYRYLLVPESCPPGSTLLQRQHPPLIDGRPILNKYHLGTQDSAHSSTASRQSQHIGSGHVAAHSRSHTGPVSTNANWALAPLQPTQPHRATLPSLSESK